MIGTAIWAVNESLIRISRDIENVRYNPYVLQETTTEVPPFTYDDLGDNPEMCQGEGFQWRGRGTPASGKGSWVRGKDSGQEVLHPDLYHPLPIGPHWDYHGPQFPGGVRLYPNGSWGGKNEFESLI